MNLEIPKDCDRRRVKVSPFEFNLKCQPHGLLFNRFHTYQKIAREDVYAALVMMCADGSITKMEVYWLESYFGRIHPDSMKPGVRELVEDLLQQLKEELGSADHFAVKPFPADLLEGALLDPRLVGIWRQKDYYSSGDFYATTNSFIEFVEDGTFRTGSRIDVSMTFRSSSGAYGGNTSASSADSGLSYAGKWETEENILVLKPVWGLEERLTYQVEERGLLTQQNMGEQKFYFRV